MPCTRSRDGSAARRAARAGTLVIAANGKCGIATSTSTSHVRASSAICCRLKGALSGSSELGKIFVTTAMRMLRAT